MRGREKFKKYSVFIKSLCFLFSIFPKKINLMLLNFFKMTQGYKGLLLRYVFLKNTAKYCGENISLHPGVYLLCPEKIELGNNVSIHPMCYIDATGGINIGNDVSIAHSVTIMSTEHVFTDINIPIKDQGVSFHLTIIKDNVWIGAKSTILAGTVINSGSIIAAGAVVKNDVDENTVVGGIPAKIIKKRV